MKKQNKGITLVALVITIIILLILAGLSISALTGSRLFKKAELAKEEYKIEQAREKINLAIADYEVKMRKETIYSILNKIDGLESIEPEDEQVGLPYTVVVDGYEFLITKNLEIIYQGTAKGAIPEIVSINKKVTNEENVEIEIVAKTDDEEGIEKLVLIKNGVEIKEKNSSGKNVIEKFNIDGNGTYEIKVIGKNKKRITSEKVDVTEMTRISGTLQQGEIIEGSVLLTVKGEIRDADIEKIEIYEKSNSTPIKEIAKNEIQIKQTENKIELETEYQVEDMPFYVDREYKAKIIAKGGKERSNKYSNFKEY